MTNLKRKLWLHQHKKQILRTTITFITAFVIAFILCYFSFAKFSSSDEFTIPITKVNVSSGDYQLSYFVDEGDGNGPQKKTDIPKKTDGYVVNNISCNNPAQAKWDYYTWGINISDVEKTGTKCNVYFSKNYKDQSGASYPELYTGLIPVKYEGSNVVVADLSSNWYDYDENMWANAVLVKSNYDSYVNEDHSYKKDTVISMDDIAQMYVWIPRYRYKLWNVNSTGGITGQRQIINIEFEDKDKEGYTKSNGTQNGEWLTHPAFTFGNKELKGIWFAKFESSNSLANIEAKPNGRSIVSQTVSSMFNASRDIQNKYNLSSGEVDSHMTKNMEWGAVAYLTGSKYGIYDKYENCLNSECEIWINNTCTGANSSTYGPSISGCSAQGVSTAVRYGATSCESGRTWDQAGIKSSTTQNMYGAYDMSGGSWEYVAGNMSTNAGAFYSSLDGFSGQPNSKYYESYTYGDTHNNAAAFNRGKLGDATREIIANVSETGGWNSDYSIFPSESNSWFLRGGGFTNTTRAGVFAFSRSTGEANASLSFRLVLVAN